MKQYIYLLLVLSLPGCVSLKQDKQAGIRNVSKLSAFNGTYQNTSEQSGNAQFSTFWHQLKLNNEPDSLNSNQTKIEITALSDTQISAVLIEGNKQKRSMVWNGKLKNNYFVSRAKRSMIPIPLIYGRFKNNQFQFALTEKNTLVVHRLQNEWGWVFLFLASNERSHSFEYKRVEK